MSEQAKDREAIEMAISEFIAAYNGGDLEKVLDYYTEDMIKIRQGDPLERKPQLAQRVAAVFAKYSTRVEVENDEIEASGDLAFTRGRFRVILSPKNGGEALTMDRRYLEIWRRQNGRWVVARAMDNEGDSL